MSLTYTLTHILTAPGPTPGLSSSTKWYYKANIQTSADGKTSVKANTNPRKMNARARRRSWNSASSVNGQYTTVALVCTELCHSAYLSCSVRQVFVRWRPSDLPSKIGIGQRTHELLRRVASRLTATRSKPPHWQSAQLLHGRGTEREEIMEPCKSLALSHAIKAISFYCSYIKTNRERWYQTHSN